MASMEVVICAPANFSVSLFVPVKTGMAASFTAEAVINIENAIHFLLGFFRRCVGGVTFMPVELCRAQEELGAQLPAQHRAPLHDQDGQVAPGFDPLRIHVTDDGLGRGTHDQLFFQLLAAAVCDDCQLRGEAFHMFLFLFKERKGDQHGERRVDVSCLLEFCIEPGGDVFPQRPAIGLYDHAAAHRCVICQVCPDHELVVPFGKVFCTGC